MSEIYLTREGRKKLIKELNELQKRKPLIQDEIARAREHGDLRENAEYHAAKETLANLMRRIMELDSKIACAKIIEEQNIDSDKVFIGVTVTIKDEDGVDYQYTVVDLEEVDPATNRISIQSPLAQGLLGHTAGETVTVELPAGRTKFKILKILRYQEN
jgi:transcription elongation factor GreA